MIMIVTGGSRGIGAAVCVSAAQRGYDVVINYASDRRAADSVASQVRSLGRQALTVRGDVAVEEDVTALFDAAEELGPLDGVVNNAAITGNTPGRLDEQNAATVRRVLDVNVGGVFLCCREAVRRMSTRYGGSGGVIVNVSSTGARTGGIEFSGVERLDQGWRSGDGWAGALCRNEGRGRDDDVRLGAGGRA